MSTILDSLKKSSNKRDDQEKASIDNFNFSDSKESSKSGFILILFLIIVTAVILYFGYQYINQEETSQKTSKTDVSAQKLEQKNKQNKTSKTMQADSTDSKKLQKPNSETVKQQLAETKVKTQQPQPIKTTVTPVQKDNGDKAELDNTNNNTSKIKIEPKSKPTTSTTQQSNRTDQSTAEKPMIQLNLPDETNNQQNSEQPEITKQEHLYVYQLPFSVRKEMPKFKLNIHIYDEDPASRVAVINGVKFAVGDLIDEQVLIKEIVRQGVLLEFNGHVFLLPIF